MELALVLKELLTHKRLMALGLCVAMLAAILSVYRVQGFLLPKLVSRDLQHSAASTQVYVDSRASLVANLEVATGEQSQLATVYANLMASPGAMAIVGRLAHIPGDQIWAAGPVDPNGQRVQIEPTATKRDVEIIGDAFPYRLEFLADSTLPIINVYSQAPTTAQAIALANASVTALRSYVQGIQTKVHTPYGVQAVIRSMGGATGGVVNSGIAKKLAAMTFTLVLLAWCLLVLVGVRVVAAWKRLRVVQGLEDAFAESPENAQSRQELNQTRRFPASPQSRR
jgi:hypothetical protein